MSNKEQVSIMVYSSIGMVPFNAEKHDLLINTPAVPSAGDSFPSTVDVGTLFWRTDKNLLYIYDGSVWKLVGGNEDENAHYLKLDGSNSPTSDISWGGNAITNLKDPVNSQDAVSKHFLDNQIYNLSSVYFRIDGTVKATGDFDLNSYKIVNVGNPTNPQDVATKSYVDSVSITGDYLALDGSTSPYANIDWDSNKIINLEDPEEPQDAATKAYVDSKIQGLDWQDSVIAIDNTPPLTPNTNDRYIVGTDPVNEWSGYANYIAEYDGSAWQFITPNEGMAVWVENSDINYTFNGSTWIRFGSTISHNNLLNLQGGSSDEYYHLTDNEHSLLTTNQNADSLHKHKFVSLEDTPDTLTEGVLRTDGTVISWADLTKSDITDFVESDYVHANIGDETINGVKTFGSIPVLPSIDPSNDNHAARKLYVDSSITAHSSDDEAHKLQILKGIIFDSWILPYYIEYTYDGDDRVDQISVYEDDTKAVSYGTITYDSYDANDNPISITYNVGGHTLTITRTYDSTGKLIAEKQIVS